MTPPAESIQRNPPLPEIHLRGAALPPRLLDLEKPPDVLYLHGELPRGPAVAIVGTRRCTPEAEAFARELAGELARAGVAVLSGGAIGIDTAAHEGALDAGGPTVVVAPAAFDKPYPPENRHLFERVLRRGGAYLTAAQGGEPAQRHAFFARNAILAALAHVVIVAECPVQSGARNAAKSARKLGRPVFVVPAVPWNPRGSGCFCELNLGARPLASHRDILRWLGKARLHAIPLSAATADEPAADPGEPSPQPSLPGLAEPTDDPGRVLQAVHAGATHADDICARTGLAPGLVQSWILTLTLQGVLHSDRTGRLQVPGGRERGSK